MLRAARRPRAARGRPRARPRRGSRRRRSGTRSRRVPAVSKSTVPTCMIRWNSDCSVLTFCTRCMRVSCVVLERIPRRMCSRSRRDHVARRHALDEADEHHEREHDGAERAIASAGARGERADRPRDGRDAHAADVEPSTRPPRRVPLEHDLLAGMQVHAANATPRTSQSGNAHRSTASRTGSGSSKSWRLGLRPVRRTHALGDRRRDRGRSRTAESSIDAPPSPWMITHMGHFYSTRPDLRRFSTQRSGARSRPEAAQSAAMS